jgi:hypothetical protein
VLGEEEGGVLRGVSFPGFDTPGSSRAPLRGEESEFRFEISELKEEADSGEEEVEEKADFRFEI